MKPVKQVLLGVSGAKDKDRVVALLEALRQEVGDTLKGKNVDPERQLEVDGVFCDYITHRDDIDAALAGKLKEEAPKEEKKK